jgi:hypothetical protein
MAQLETTITTSCNDCGKGYKVAAAMLGRRVKCRACGNQFQVGQAKTLASVSTVPSGSVANIARPKTISWPAAMPAHEKLRIIARYLFWIWPSGWLILGFLVFSISLGLGASRFPDLFWGAMIGFRILAGAFLLIGTVAATMSAIASPDEFKAPWADVLKVTLWIFIGGLLLTAILGVGVIRYRKNAFTDDAFGAFYHRIASLTFRVMGVAVMSAVLIGVAVGSGSEPQHVHTPSAMESRANKIIEEQRTGQPQPMPDFPRPVIPHPDLSHLRR